MRICLLSYRGNMYCGGQGVYVYYLSKFLARQGHEVTLVQGPPYTWDTPWCEQVRLGDYNMFATRKFFTKFMPRGASPLTLFTPINFYEFAATRFGFFPEMLAFSLRAYNLLRERWARGGFDVIHDNQTLAYGLILMKAFGAPVVATIHHPLSEDRVADFQQLPGLYDRLKRVVYYPIDMNRRVTPFMDDVITVSKAAAASVSRSFGIARERIRVVYNGVDTESFRPDPAVKKKPRSLIFVGNTEDRKKGARYLMEAMLHLPKDVTLTVVDGGAPRHLLMEELMKKLHLTGRVTCTGKIAAPELVKKYQEAEIGVVASVYEGFGFPASEAMSCGLPVVSTRGGALPEVVGEDGKAGFLVPPRDPAAMAAAIRKLLDNDGLRRSMGERGRARIEELFSWDTACRSMTRVYQENIDRKRMARRMAGVA
ncbi:MAG TPA: glycosyltransferase family 4 protein [bacterium]|nr:glycosyltransferase family 4 protein [bacterium]